jgi:ribonuclease E
MQLAAMPQAPSPVTATPVAAASESSTSSSMPVAAPVQRPVQAVPVAVAAAPAAAVGLPKVQSYNLPVNDMAAVAAGSGLQWVNSDASKIAAVQAQIAAEAKPVHVPRERPPVVAVKNEPLVMVETKRDLS